MEIKTVKRPPARLPVLAMRGLVLFPRMLMHFDVERKRSIVALNQAMERDRRIFLITQREIEVEKPEQADLYEVGVIAEIRQLLRMSDDTVRVLVSGVVKASLLELDTSKPYLEASVRRIPQRRFAMEPLKEQALIRTLKEAFTHYAEVVPKCPKEILAQLYAAEGLKETFDLVVQNVILPYEDKQDVLEMNSLPLCAEALIKSILSETDLLTLERSIFDRVRDQMDENQHEYFLREQMKAIADQLGEGDDSQADVLAFEEQIKAIQHLSDESKEKLLKECDRLLRMPASSQEANVIRTYLETCLELPWDTVTEDHLDIPAAKAILDRDHYGMDKVKDRILESLSVRKLNPELKGQILCLVGPPGVGKTSIARAIAEAIGRKYVRLSLGGVRDESDIRGHRKTYIGAMPGRIITAFSTVKSRNPLMLLDEIDKMGSDFRGDPSAAMLEVLDAEQNNAFRDHYIEIPFDLSDTLFVTTANAVETIPAPLLDRMEVIELSSYTREEKFQIAKRHLLKKQREKHGLTAKQMTVSDSALYALIDHYTREAGVRKLERAIASLCRKAARAAAENPEAKTAVTVTNLERYLGPKKYKIEQISKTDEIGVVNGLAWTSVGGELLQIEVSVVEGSGKIEITGNLGDVMKESARIAVTYVRRIAEQYRIEPNFYKTKDIHIHAPEGAVPKDGPSAGVTMTTALISALTGIPVRHDVAMTGEISLLGKVLPIGGLKEKTMAAYRAGIHSVLIPEDNLPDLAEVDKTVTDRLRFIPCKTLTGVLDAALSGTGTKPAAQPMLPVQSSRDGKTIRS